MTKSLVDVVIPAKNQSQLVLRCIQSLRAQKRIGDIILIDDGSQDSDRDIFKTIPNVNLYRNSGSEGFIKSTSRGVNKSKAPYVLLLNSDTEAYHTDCLKVMAENLDDGAKICGALLLYPKNDLYRPERIQHAAIYYGSDGFPNHIFGGWHAATPAANVKRIVPAVTGACFMVKRDWWEKLNGWDNKLGRGVFEDVDACIRTIKMGGEIIYEPKSVFTHYEHASQELGSNWFTRENIQKNFQYLTLKHGIQPPSDSYWFKGIA